MKTTSIFGGVQVFNILISIIRSKFVAVLLGSAGIGLMGIYQSVLTMITSIASLGISSSALQDISVAHASGDQVNISKMVGVFFRWVWLTGIGGALLACLLSPVLSTISFGDRSHTIDFIFLSAIILMSIISISQNTLLKGMRKVNEVAKANIWGSVLGLFTSLPLYYLYGMQGIVPSLIISALTTLLLSWYFARKLYIKPIYQSWSDTFREGKEMVKMGILMTISGFVFSLVGYVLIVFIKNHGGINDIGLYQAGNSITTKYVGMVFTAMAMDFYPRLSGVNHDNEKVKTEVNQQAEIALLILGPLLILMITSMPVLIRVLYTIEFLPMLEFVQWMTIGILIKSASWCLGYILLAKRETKLFFITEVGGHFLTLILNIICYSLWGLNGLGISFILSYLVYFVVMLVLCDLRYHMKFDKGFYWIFFAMFTLSTLSFLFARIGGFPKAYFTCSILFALSLAFSFYMLNKRMDLKVKILAKLKIN